MRTEKISCSPSFGMKPISMKFYTQTIKEGLQVLDKEIGLIIHNSSAPSDKAFDFGIGSLLSEKSRNELLPFLKQQGFKLIQQDPDYLRGKNISPYSPIASSKNIYMIPLDRYTNRFPQSFLIPEPLLKTASLGESEEADFNYGKKKFDEYLDFAYESYKNNYYLKTYWDKFDKDFKEFKNDNYDDLLPDAAFEILAHNSGTENWELWDPEERDLFYAKGEKADELREDFTKIYKDKIDFFMFKQFLLNREIKSSTRRRAKLGIKMSADSPIAFTPVEQWVNQDLFMKGYALGCPPDGFTRAGQRWGFAVLKPETIFNPDGSLGKGGKLLKARYEKMFKASAGGARIDHIIGLIDPFVYSVDDEQMTPENSGRLYSSPEHPIFGKYARKDIKEYFEIIEKIVLPAAKKYGLKKEDIICEDLGRVTEPVKTVMKELGLSGITLTQYNDRGRDAKPENVIMVGSHDNKSYIEVTDEFFGSQDERVKKQFQQRLNHLSWDTNLFTKPKSYRRELRSNKRKFITASFTELFTSPARRVQIFFTDFFGIPKTYNTPGTEEGNWILRLRRDFENMYYKNLEKGIGINLPEVILNAIVHKEGDLGEHRSLVARLKVLRDILRIPTE